MNTTRLSTSGFVERAHALLYNHRRTVALTTYAVLTAVAYAAAFLLRFEFSWPARYTGVFLATLPLLLAIRLGFGLVFKLSMGRWRFVGTRDVLRLGGAMASGTVVFFLATRLLPFAELVPRSIFLIEFVLTSYLVAGVWISYRTVFEMLRHRRSGHNGSARRALLVGAGEAAHMLVHEMARYPTGHRPIGFVDDDPRKWGTMLHGLEVIGSTADLSAIAEQTNAEELIVAVPSAGPRDLRRVIERCEETELTFKILPGISEVLEGGDGSLSSQLRDVQIEDLLGREPVELGLPELADDLEGRSVLITGAAGSIGSELTRQVALHGPARLVLFDQAETDLYLLERELRARHPALALVACVGDITNADAVEATFRAYRPDRVFHAAAYKHVPLMETNTREAVRNNVVGTWRVADAAGRYGAGKFVLVSTDKAVRPTSVMGATKRLAEIVVVDLQDRFPETAYAAVRFGNVLGSNGSVIPIFKRQLADGDPLTVTHPEATRYFMTIPEASRLILQASLLDKVRGNIAMLEMGEPVRITDLAHNLLRLSGVPPRPGENIVFTKLRPGEKLHEELVAPREDTVPTGTEKIRIVLSVPGLVEEVRACLPEWDGALENGRLTQLTACLHRVCPDLQTTLEVDIEGDGAEAETALPMGNGRA